MLFRCMCRNVGLCEAVRIWEGVKVGSRDSPVVGLPFTTTKQEAEGSYPSVWIRSVNASCK